MKRVVFLFSLLLICSLICLLGETLVSPTIGVAFGQSGAGKTCPFSITGVWRVEGRTRTAKTFFYDFEPDGAIMISEHTADVLPREYEAIGVAKYVLDKPEAPKRVEFIADFRSGAIPWGKTTLLVVEYGEDSFVTENPKTHDQIRWVRAQTHRYFLTFAARSGQRYGAGSALAMWTTLDGRETKFDALGLRLTKENGGDAVPIFGPIPPELYHEFEDESFKDSDIMMRFELAKAEFERTYKVFEIWNEYARTATPPHDNPYLNAMEFLKRTAGSLNQCDEKVKLPIIANPMDSRNPHQHLLEYIKVMRKNNRDLHITNGMFPSDWFPIQLPNG
jgi:hypothetical protein